MEEDRLQKDTDLSIPFEHGMTLEYHGHMKQWNFQTCAELNTFGPKTPGARRNSNCATPLRRIDPALGFHTLPVNCFHVDWEARNIVTGSADHNLKLWNMYGNVLRTFSGSACEVLCVNVDWRNNQMISGQLDNSLMTWRLDESDPLEIFRVTADYFDKCSALGYGEGGVKCVEVDWRKGRAICCVSKHLLLWDITQVSTEVGKNGSKVPHTEPQQSLRGHTHTVTGVIVDWARMIATSGSMDRSLRQWDLNTGTQLRVFTDGVPQVTCIGSRRGFSTKFIATGDTSGCVKYWDLESGECLVTLAEHTAEVTTISPIENKHVASGSRDGTVRVFSLADKTCKRKIEICESSHGIVVVGLSMQPPATRSIERHGTFGGGRLSAVDSGLGVDYE
eukprot:TRINITY_DN17711_c0_g1_i2.p1 TRINITY_DN17711_c0_g1~~TRINITY_DN17711_c0_g1_i2.p1  ORF type:complete len:392 (+),score=41.62 TRINITY_DN17711_c0_g1_i2:352-1527(+)